MCGFNSSMWVQASTNPGPTFPSSDLQLTIPVPPIASLHVRDVDSNLTPDIRIALQVDREFRFDGRGAVLLPDDDGTVKFGQFSCSTIGCKWHGSG